MSSARRSSSQDADEPEGTERIAVRRFDWEEAWRMLKAGEITDSLSVIAILHEAVRRLEEPASERVRLRAGSYLLDGLAALRSWCVAQ